MSLKAVVDGYTAWSNVRLVKGDCEATDILDDIMRGSRMKILLRGEFVAWILILSS